MRMVKLTEESRSRLLEDLLREVPTNIPSMKAGFLKSLQISVKKETKPCFPIPKPLTRQISDRKMSGSPKKKFRKLTQK